MKLLYLLRPTLVSPDQGFSLVEVMISMMVTSIFVAVTMQTILVAAIFRNRGSQYDQAVTWIQEDFEQVVNQATQFEVMAVPESVRCNAVDPEDGLAAGFLAEIDGLSLTDGSRTLGGEVFTLNRTGDYENSVDPYKLLQLSYTVTPQGGGEAIASLSTEVLLTAALKCKN